MASLQLFVGIRVTLAIARSFRISPAIWSALVLRLALLMAVLPVTILVQ